MTLSLGGRVAQIPLNQIVVIKTVNILGGRILSETKYVWLNNYEYRNVNLFKWNNFLANLIITFATK